MSTWAIIRMEDTYKYPICEVYTSDGYPSEVIPFIIDVAKQSNGTLDDFYAKLVLNSLNPYNINDAPYHVDYTYVIRDVGENYVEVSGVPEDEIEEVIEEIKEKYDYNIRVQKKEGADGNTWVIIFGD